MPTYSPSISPTQLPTQKPTTSEIIYFDSGVTECAAWSGPVIGVNHYGNNPDVLPIVVMLVSGDASTWFIGFNHEHVTITKGEGGQYSLMGILVAGQTETISNWRGSALDLVVKVEKINTNVIPEYADIEITFGADGPCLITPKPVPSTTEPTGIPSSLPTDYPTKNPIGFVS
jgi:hypothetical protein